jgi:hypothetical protein
MQGTQSPTAESAAKKAPNPQMQGVVGHMNQDHGDSLIAYSEFYGGLIDVRNAILTDLDLNGLFVTAMLGDGSQKEVMIPYESGPLKSMQEMGGAVKTMSRKARDAVFVTAAPGVTDKVGFAPFNQLNEFFKKQCADGNFAALIDAYASDAVLVPQFPGPPPASAPLFFGKDAIGNFLAFEGQNLLPGLAFKPMRLLQTSNTEVTEIGRAWGLPGRTYSRQWEKIEGKWLLKHDNLPVMPPAYATIDMNAIA